MHLSHPFLNYSRLMVEEGIENIFAFILQISHYYYIILYQSQSKSRITTVFTTVGTDLG